MTYRIVDHTADLGIDVRAPSLEKLFAEAARGFVDCITEVDAVEARTERTVRLRADSTESLLVEWLSELLYVFETTGELLPGVEVEIAQSGADWELVARARGERFDERRHPLKVPIKAVTWHDLRVRQRESAWEARVIFDI